MSPREANAKRVRAWTLRRLRGVLLFMFGAVLSACSSAPVATMNPAQQAASSLNREAGRLLARGDTAAALQDYRRVLTLAESLDDPAMIGGALLNIARVHAQRREAVPAQAAVDRILAQPAYFDAALRTDAAIRKALLSVDAGDMTSAAGWVDAAAASCAAPCMRAATLHNLRAQLAFSRGDFDAAATSANAALAVANAAGDETAIASGNPAVEAGGDTHERANALRLLGRLDTRAGRTDRAAAFLEQALAIDRRLGLPDRIALDLLLVADNEQRRGRDVAARALLERALAVYSASGNTSGAAAVRARLAQTGTTPR